MTDTTTPAELEIPALALARHDLPHRPLLTDDDVLYRIRDVAAPIVAAELRRIATQAERELQPVRVGRAVEASSARRREGVEIVAYRLRARADELDGGQR